MKERISRTAQNTWKKPAQRTESRARGNPSGEERRGKSTEAAGRGALLQPHGPAGQLRAQAGPQPRHRAGNAAGASPAPAPEPAALPPPAATERPAGQRRPRGRVSARRNRPLPEPPAPHRVLLVHAAERRAAAPGIPPPQPCRAPAPSVGPETAAPALAFRPCPAASGGLSGHAASPARQRWAGTETGGGHVGLLH